MFFAALVVDTTASQPVWGRPYGPTQHGRKGHRSTRKALPGVARAQRMQNNPWDCCPVAWCGERRCTFYDTEYSRVVVLGVDVLPLHGNPASAH